MFFNERLKPFFFFYKITFLICVDSVVNSQRLFCSKKSGVKCYYKSFLVYKMHYPRNLIRYRSKSIFNAYLVILCFFLMAGKQTLAFFVLGCCAPASGKPGSS